MNTRRLYPLIITLALLPFFISEREIELAAEQSPVLEAATKINQLNPDALRGVYMTNLVATDQGAEARKKRQAILKLIDEEKINALVIDVKEAAGLTLNENLTRFIGELRRKNVYIIARFVLMLDNSQREKHPDWYLKTKDGRIWKDQRNNSWLNPADEAVQDYLIESAKKTAEFGFNEIQFDYIRYPADGALKRIAYGEKAQSAEGRFQIINDSAAQITTALRFNYGETLRLSADIFGYLTVLKEDKIIGQRLLDLSPYFDYLSPMVYPSHYYKGLRVAADVAKQLPPLNYSYGSKNLHKDVVNYPYETVFRSLLAAQDILNQASTTAKIRPWLQAFNLNFDLKRGVIYDANKIYLQIKAAEDAGSQGWLLWNAANVYPALISATTTSR